MRLLACLLVIQNGDTKMLQHYLIMTSDLCACVAAVNELVELAIADLYDFPIVLMCVRTRAEAKAAPSAPSSGESNVPMLNFSHLEVVKDQQFMALRDKVVPGCTVYLKQDHICAQVQCEG